MSLISIDWNPDRKKLRQFAAAWIVVFMTLAIVSAFRLGAFHGSGRWLVPEILGAISLAGLLGVIVPAAIRPCYLILTAITFPIGFVVGHLLLGLIYFGVFTPVALIFRLMGRDVLCRRFDPAAVSYLSDHPGPAAAGRYFRQF